MPCTFFALIFKVFADSWSSRERNAEGVMSGRLRERLHTLFSESRRIFERWKMKMILCRPSAKPVGRMADFCSQHYSHYDHHVRLLGFFLLVDSIVAAALPTDGSATRQMLPTRQNL